MPEERRARETLLRLEEFEMNCAVIGSDRTAGRDSPGSMRTEPEVAEGI